MYKDLFFFVFRYRKLENSHKQSYSSFKFHIPLSFFEIINIYEYSNFYSLFFAKYTLRLL